jgi:hypothetical protein
LNVCPNPKTLKIIISYLYKELIISVVSNNGVSNANVTPLVARARAEGGRLKRRYLKQH